MKLSSSPRFWLLLALAILPLTINNDSLWLDEGDTAMYAVEPTLHSWCQRLLHDGQADCQMPLGMFSAWVGGKIFGTQEWQLRAVNLLWGALALLALSRVGRRLQMPWLPLLLSIQPYFWFYMNEARPYALQLACGSWLLLSLVECIQARGGGRQWPWLFSLSAVFLFASTMLAPLPVAITVVVIGLLARRQGWRFQSKAGMILAGGFLACVPLAIYYVSTLLRGAKGAQMWSVDPKFILYVFYELTGMGGIGLSSLEIRSLARSPHLVHELMLRLPQLLLPMLLAVLLAVVFIIGLRRVWNTERKWLLFGIAAVPLATALFFVVGSLLLHKAFWARHYAPVFPFYVALLGLAFGGIAGETSRWPRLLPFGIGILLIYSALNFRFAPSLRKEDYRAASAYAVRSLADQKNVWWVAGGYAASYYGLPLAEKFPEPGKAFIAWLPPVDLSVLPVPDVIVLSKPDVHDAGGRIQKIITENHYAAAATFQSFVVWTNSPAR